MALSVYFNTSVRLNLHNFHWSFLSTAQSAGSKKKKKKAKQLCFAKPRLIFPQCNGYLSWLLTDAARTTWVEINTFPAIEEKPSLYVNTAAAAAAAAAGAAGAHTRSQSVEVIGSNASGRGDPGAARVFNEHRGSGMEAGCSLYCG